MFYDPKVSDKGIMQCIVKQEKRKPVDGSNIFAKPIYTPSVFEDEREKELEKDPFNPNNQNYNPSSYITPESIDPRIKINKIMNDPKVQKKPEQPL